eukprot:TRINITY_DN50_c0_g7_i1.p1 TRINITY_DN50_c0_g7~~TRINITY_DN50_c0_g7_i1.p1  ORF type:complete len:1297 (-),score=480.05 TRINITY_DN50_c0_g7_i1:226-4116(-)
MSDLDKRRSSAEIVAVANELRQRSQMRSKSKFSFKKKKEEVNLKENIEMDEHQIPMQDLVARLDSNLTSGLTDAQVAAKQEREGHNRLSPPETTPEWLKLFRQLTGFFALLLWLGSFLCLIGFVLKGEADNLYLAIVLAAVVTITGIFSYMQERNSSNLMDSFKNMMPTVTVVTRNGKDVEINAIDLCRGDIVKVKGGDKVPADIRVISCTDDFEVDNACLTGESEPQKRAPECSDVNPLETKNLIFFGTLIPKGRCTGIVVSIGDRSVMGRIAALATNVDADMTPIGKEIHHFILIVSGVAITLGVGFFIIGLMLDTDMITNLVFMIGIIVANVPEGLLATVTVCLTLTAKRMASKSVLVKNLEGVETLGSTTCICSDKTGTLTQNVMTVANLLFDNTIFSTELVANDRWALYDDKNVTLQKFQRCMTLCNNATFDENSKYEEIIGADGKKTVNRDVSVEFMSEKILGDGSKQLTINWKTLGDGSESALIKLVQNKQDVVETRKLSKKLCEIPFNSANKYQVSIHQLGESNNTVLVMKGAPERIISRCSHVLMNGEEVELTEELKNEIEEKQMTLQAEGRRVLGFCEKELPDEYTPDYEFNIDTRNFPMGEASIEQAGDIVPDNKQLQKLTFIGLAALIDPPRVQVPPAVSKCKTAGIKVVMVTGDHPVTAKAIAKEVGIIWGKTSDDIIADNKKAGAEDPSHPDYVDPCLAPAIVVAGKEFSVDTAKETWDYYLDHTQIVFARTSPQQKLLIVENCQERGEIVAVTGDGVNDSPALKKADIGVAMGIMGSDVSKEAADMILLDDNFASIVAGIEEGRLIFDNLKKSIAYTLSSNIPEISPFLLFITLQIPLPLSTVLILCVDLGTDMVPAISMAWETAEADIMRRPPRNSSVDRLVTKKLVVFAYLQIGVIQACAGFFTYFVVLNDYGYPPSVLFGLGAFDNWGKQIMYCKFEDGMELVNKMGTAYTIPTGQTIADYFDTAIQEGFAMWDGEEVEDCVFAAKNYLGRGSTGNIDLNDAATFLGGTEDFELPSLEAIEALYKAEYYPYVPYKAVTSPFWKTEWLKQNVDDSDIPGFGSADELLTFQHQLPGVFRIETAGIYTSDTSGGLKAMTEAEDALDLFTFTDTTPIGNRVYREATFVNDAANFKYHMTTLEGNVAYTNVASRMAQKEALHHAQCAFFCSIVVVQWADLMICKTRWLSIHHQKMTNVAMNFGLLFETILACCICYFPAFNVAVKTRDIRLVHWFCGMPFSVLIFLYDEVRKFVMRKTTQVTEDKETGRVISKYGWLAKNTYY